MADYSIQKMLDAAKNFGKVTVSAGYSNLDTVIVLNSGDGTRLPNPSTDGEFNLTWWNSTDYPDPADDPNREIVRATAKTGDILTVIRGQEGISASNKNTPGKTYKMILSITAKIIPDIQSDAQTRVDTHAAITTSVHNFDSSGYAPPTLHGGEAHKGNVVTKIGIYEASLSDDTILCDATGGPFSISLPAASSRIGKIYNIKKIDNSSNTIIISPPGNDTIETLSSLTINNQWDYYTLQSIQSGATYYWIILASTPIISAGPIIYQDNIIEPMITNPIEATTDKAISPNQITNTISIT